MSLHSELKNLFHPHTIRQAKRLEPEKVDALAVKSAAGALLHLKGRPMEQVALVKALHPDTAAALCRWIADPAFWGLVAGITKH